MNVTRRIFWTTFGTAVVAAVTFSALLIWIAGETNRMSAEDTQRRIALTVEGLIERNELVLTDYSAWTLAYEWVLSKDEDTLYDNIGSGAAEAETFDLIYLLSPQGAPEFAYMSDLYSSELSIVDPEILKVREALVTAPTLPPEATISDLISSAGAIYIVGVTRIRPDERDGLAATDLPIMLGATRIDPVEIGKILSMPEVRLEPLGAAAKPEMNSYVLKNQAGEPLARLVWTPDLPGQKLLVKVAPLVALITVFLILCSAIVGRASARQTEALLRERVSARTDPVTGLLNRSGLSEVVNMADVAARIQAEQAALVYVDLNGLKKLNDTYGHKVGDEAIRVTGQRLSQAVRKGDFVARLGGDEFVCLILDDSPRAAAMRIAERIQTMSEDKVTLGRLSFTATPAIGVSLARSGISWDRFLSQADTAMYQAKRANTPSAVFFEDQARTLN